jgi:hypothetical protein
MLTATDLSLYYLLDGTNTLTGNMNAGTFRLTNLGDGVDAQDAVTVNQLSGYLPLSGVAVDSLRLNGQPDNFYQNASNINSGTIGDAYLPATISSDITGNAATATSASTLTTARTIELSGDITSPAVAFDGSTNITIPTVIAVGGITLPTLTAGLGMTGSYDGTSTETFNLIYGGAGSYWGSLSTETVARSDHYHHTETTVSVSGYNPDFGPTVVKNYLNNSRSKVQIFGEFYGDLGLPFTATNGSALGFIPVGYRPLRSQYANAVIFYDNFGDQYETCLVEMQSTGALVYHGTTRANTYKVFIDSTYTGADEL